MKDHQILAVDNIEFSELVGQIYDSALTGDWTIPLDRLVELTGSNKAFFILQELGSDNPLIMEVKATFDLDMDAITTYQQRAFEDPGYEYLRMLTEGDHLYVNKLMDVNDHSDTSFYKEIYQPLRVFHAIAGVLCRDGKHESIVVVNRDEDAPAYTEQDENLIQMLTPHFSRAMHIFKELRLYKQYATISKSVLDQQDKAILVCDADGRVVVQNAFATTQLVHPSMVTIDSGVLRVANPLYQERLSYFIEQCAGLAYKEIGLQETLVIEQEEADNILIAVSPIRNQHTFSDIEVPCCLVTINRQHQPKWQAVRDEFALTPKELQLIKAIYSKKKLNDLTDEFGVTYNTLRTHLQSIFKKTRVNSQTELLIKLNVF